MGNLDSEGLDEAHCLLALCSHPCCWKTQQCIAKGIYRRTSRKPNKLCSPVNDNFPSLTVVNVWEWAGSRGPSEGRLLLNAVSSDSLESERSLHSIAFPVHPQKETSQSLKSADPFVKSVNPVSQPIAVKGKGVQLNKVHICPDLIGSEGPLGSTSLVLWVPNPHYIPQCITQKRSNLPQCAVKELTCPSTCLIQKTSKKKEKPKRVKKSLTFPCPSGERQRIDISEPITEPSSKTTENRVNQKQRKESPLILRNRPVAFHTMQDRGIKSVSMNVLTSSYKLDSKTRGESIEWNKLRRHTYLWKRHNPLHHKDCNVSVSPPGDANVLLVDSCLCPVSSVRPLHPLQSPLSVAPSVQKSRCLPMSQRKYLSHSTSSEADILSTVCSSSTAVDHRAFIQMPDTGKNSVRGEGIKGSITPFNSLLTCQQLSQEHQDPTTEMSTVQADHSFPEKSNHSSNSSQSFISGAKEPWNENSFNKKRPEPKSYQLCTPPPSLSSL